MGESDVVADAMSSDCLFTGDVLASFDPTTEDEVRTLITSSPSKSCNLDPIPTWLLKECVGELLPIITAIINQSLLKSIVPAYFNRANVKPLIKKAGLDKEVLKNYRPVSNLPFISKLVEKVVSVRLQRHLKDNTLYDFFQSAYRQHHSTESALLKVHNDIFKSLDQKLCTAMIMLDLSAAFDLINHDILFHRLEFTFGIVSESLRWFESYLNNRVHCVEIGNTLSNEKILQTGVPQGSVLGPIIYCMFTRPLGQIISRHGLSYHCYADDTQLYTDFNSIDCNDISNKLESCLSEIVDWMQLNRLKLNRDKTELILFSQRGRPDFSPNFNLEIGSHEVFPVSVVKNLGVFFDNNLSMESQINSICKSCYFQIRSIGKIRRYISDAACKTLIHSLVISKLDYCNALLYGLPDKSTDRLQRVQNCAARVISRTRRNEHISPVLIDLHWLPVNQKKDRCLKFCSTPLRL